MSKYMILIFEREADYATMTPEGWASVVDAHSAFTKAVPDLGGQIVGGEAVQQTNTAKSIRSGKVTDGPFFESKEALAGYYVVEARDLDHALEIAKLTPAPLGGVEVRPVLDAPTTPAVADRVTATLGAVAEALADAHRREWAFVLAATVRVAGDLDVARSARRRPTSKPSSRGGAPGCPTARGRGSRRRHGAAPSTGSAATSRCGRKLPLLVGPVQAPEEPGEPGDDEAVPDDRLRLLFTCCHPALDPAARVALTLRLVCAGGDAGRLHARSPCRSRSPSTAAGLTPAHSSAEHRRAIPPNKRSPTQHTRPTASTPQGDPSCVQPESGPTAVRSSPSTSPTPTHPPSPTAR
jgi:hypothetical protein